MCVNKHNWQALKNMFNFYGDFIVIDIKKKICFAFFKDILLSLWE